MDPAGAGANNGCKQWVPSLCSVHLSAMRSGAASTWQAQAVSPTWTGLLCSRAPALKTRPSSCAVGCGFSRSQELQRAEMSTFRKKHDHSGENHGTPKRTGSNFNSFNSKRLFACCLGSSSIPLSKSTLVPATGHWPNQFQGVTAASSFDSGVGISSVPPPCLQLNWNNSTYSTSDHLC